MHNNSNNSNNKHSLQLSCFLLFLRVLLTAFVLLLLPHSRFALNNPSYSSSSSATMYTGACLNRRREPRGSRHGSWPKVRDIVRDIVRDTQGGGGVNLY